MPRPKHNQRPLHEVMGTILLGEPNRTASLKVLSQENERRDLYRKRDGTHPLARQFGARAHKQEYRHLFAFVRRGVLRYVGPD